MGLSSLNPMAKIQCKVLIINHSRVCLVFTRDNVPVQAALWKFVFITSTATTTY